MRANATAIMLRPIPMRIVPSPVTNRAPFFGNESNRFQGPVAFAVASREKRNHEHPTLATARA